MGRTRPPDKISSVFPEFSQKLQVARTSYDLTVFVIYRINLNKFIFPVIRLKDVNLIGQNDWPTESLPAQIVILIHCPLIGHYFEPNFKAVLLFNTNIIGTESVSCLLLLRMAKVIMN